MHLKSGAAVLAALALPMIAAQKSTAAQTEIEFSRVAGAPLLMDASIPEGAGPFPAAIIVHGGGWVRGDRRTDVAPLFKPLADARIAWFSIDYRLAADITLFGAAVDDVSSAIRFVKAHAAEYHIDPQRIALIGESAGGQLAAMAALNATPQTRVKAVVALYSPMDLVDLARTSTFVPTQIRNSLQGTPFEKLLLARLEQLSPIANVSADAPPFLLIHGTADRLVPFAQSEAMCDKLKTAGASCELYSVPGAGHGIRWWQSGTYKQEMVRWLTEHLQEAL